MRRCSVIISVELGEIDCLRACLNHAVIIFTSLVGVHIELLVIDDIFVIAEFPDDETAAQAALTLAKSGNVTTKTLRAFTLDELRDIVRAMP